MGHSTAQPNSTALWFPMEYSTSPALQCIPNQMGLLNEWPRLWRTFSKDARKTRKICTLLFLSFWATPLQNCLPAEKLKPDYTYACTNEILLTAMTMNPGKSNWQCVWRNKHIIITSTQDHPRNHSKFRNPSACLITTRKPASLVSLY